MKIKRRNRVLTFTGLMVAALVSVALLRRGLSGSFFNLLNSDVRRSLEWPIFAIGNISLTPLFLIKFILFLIALSLLSRLFRSFLSKRILIHTSMDRGHQYAFVRVSGYIVFVLGLVIGLEAAGLNLSSLLVVGGALGVGIGFGLQNIVANFVAGIVILWEGAVKLGDFIDVGNVNGSSELTVTHGEVIRIGARGTWVQTFDNQVIIVPNSELINSRIANWTANGRTVRFTVPIGVSYDSDLNLVRAVLLEIAKRSEDVLEEPAPAVVLTGFGDNSVNMSLRVSTTTMTDRTVMVKSDLLMEIFRVFREKKITLPYPISDPPGKPTQTVALGQSAA
jgi:small-conductance mechanosensitive channel